MPLLPKKKVLTSEKVTTSEQVEKGTKLLDYIKYAVFNIRRKDLDNFQEQSKVSIGQFKLDHEFLKRKASTLKMDIYILY